MRLALVLLLSTGCTVTMDYVPTPEPEILRAGHEVLSRPTATVRTERGSRVTVDGHTLLQHTDDEKHVQAHPLRTMADDCWGQKRDTCLLGDNGDYAIEVDRHVPDKPAILTGLAIAGVTSLVGGYVTAHVTCFTSWCDDVGKGAFIVGDVVAVLALGTFATIAFFSAVFHGLAN